MAAIFLIAATPPQLVMSGCTAATPFAFSRFQKPCRPSSRSPVATGVLSARLTWITASTLLVVLALRARRAEAVAAPVLEQVPVRVLEVDVDLALLVTPRTVELHAVLLQVLERGLAVAVPDPEVEVLARAALEGERVAGRGSQRPCARH